MNPRNAIATFILLIAMLAGSVAYTAFIVRRVTNEPATVADAATSVINQPAIRDQMVDSIAEQILITVGPTFTTVATDAGLDPADEARLIAQDAVKTPEYETAVRETLIELHEMTFVGPQAKLFINVEGVSQATRSAAIDRNPLYEPIWPTEGALVVKSPIDKVPDLTGLKDRVNDAYGLSLTIALGGFAAAFALHDRRHRVIRRIGIWAVFLAAGHLLVSWVLPGIADVYIDEVDDTPIAETLTRTIGSFVRTPALVVFVVGVALIIGSFVWQASAGSMRLANRVGGGDRRPRRDGRVAPQAPPPPPPTGAYHAAPPQGPPAGPPVSQPGPTTGTYPSASPTAPPPAPPAGTPTGAPTQALDPESSPFAPPDLDEPPEGDSVFENPT